MFVSVVVSAANGMYMGSQEMRLVVERDKRNCTSTPQQGNDHTTFETVNMSDCNQIK